MNATLSPAPSTNGHAHVKPPTVEAVAPAATLDWSHLRGFQSVEPATETRDDYSEELQKELSARAARFARSVDESIVLASDGVLRWLGDPVARIPAIPIMSRPAAVETVRATFLTVRTPRVRSCLPDTSRRRINHKMPHRAPVCKRPVRP